MSKPLNSPEMDQVSSVILIDRDQFYLARVADRLRSVLPCPVLVATPGSWPYIESPGSLSAPNPDLLNLACGLVLADHATCMRIKAADQPAGGLDVVEWLEYPLAGSDQPYRLMSMHQLAAWIQNRLPEIGQSQIERRIHDVAPNQSGRPADALLVALELGWPGHTEWVRRRISSSIAEGHLVIYLPLMPTYRMSLIQAPGRGPNMTALILRLANGEEVTPEDLGHYLEPHHDGFWQFRPPERADDLILANPPALRELVSLLRRKTCPGNSNMLNRSETDTVRLEELAETSGKPRVIVDCSGLPLQTVSGLAVMANAFACRFGVGNDWSSSAGQRELGTLMAKLPSSCSIIEMNQES